MKTKRIRYDWVTFFLLYERFCLVNFSTQLKRTQQLWPEQINELIIFSLAALAEHRGLQSSYTRPQQVPRQTLRCSGPLRALWPSSIFIRQLVTAYVDITHIYLQTSPLLRSLRISFWFYFYCTLYLNQKDCIEEKLFSIQKQRIIGTICMEKDAFNQWYIRVRV